jgi:pimeloyl-ACP methyl ester carboxylesterase
MKLSQRLALSYVRTKFKLLSSVSKKKAAEKAFVLFCTPQFRNKKPLPKNFEKAEKLHFKIDGLNVQGWRWQPLRPPSRQNNSVVNPPDHRKALIVHGFESSVVNFEKYIKPLTSKGYEVLAFDAPAHGRSSGKQINAPLYKRMILEIYKGFGPVQSYMAHSFGGLAVCLALEEISHTTDYRLALIAPATETTTALDSFFKYLQLAPSIRPEFEKLIIKRGGAGPAWYSIRRAMKHIRAKVLWVHDENDDTTPLTDVMKVKAENYPNIEFVITKGLGHRRIYRDNAVAKSVIDFL